MMIQVLFFLLRQNSIFFRCECQWIEVFPLRRMDLELARLSVFCARSMGPRPQHYLAGKGGSCWRQVQSSQGLDAVGGYHIEIECE